MRLLPNTSTFRSLNFFNYISLLYFTSFYAIIILNACFEISPEIIYNFILCLSEFGSIVYIYTLPIFSLLFILIAIEAFLIKKSLICPLKPNMGIIMQRIFLGLSIFIILFFYVQAFFLLGPFWHHSFKY